MEKRLFTIENNEKLAETVRGLTLTGDTGALVRPGQFVNLALEGFYLRRPISVCDLEGDKLTLVYKTVGKGTEKLAAMKKGERLDLLTGLGNGFDTGKSGPRPLLVGGGAGAPPLYLLAKRLLEEGKSPRLILGFKTAREVFLENAFRALGCAVLVTTADGSYAAKGFVTDALDRCGAYDYCFACGPEPMLRAVYTRCGTDGQFSFEARMGCGFGACMGCTCRTKYGHKRICRDGPVLEKGEIVW
ncbi:MAG: dihydroorotate dehydrogenase electron transfer subunit [Oscillospiraceae bacterium]|jgi:dihydroorotate dehydrogenase electron transfer subunit|nr:dihydroorotate dehydrogenase electron transfer subunit [Oscillospiraceae bacterium]